MDRLLLSADCRRTMIAAARARFPSEAVGLVAGRFPRIGTEFVELPNSSAGLTFRVAPRDQFDAMLQLLGEGLGVVATFHSHPRGGAALSTRDVAGLQPWECPHVVLGLADAEGGRDHLAAFQISHTGPQEVPLVALTPPRDADGR